MSHRNTLNDNLPCLDKNEKRLSLYSNDPYEITFYFFVPQEVFFEIYPILGTFDDFLKADGQQLGLWSSTIVKFAWAIGGPETYDTLGVMSGGAVSITEGQIEGLFENEYSQLVDVAEQASIACSKYSYPNSSWTLIHETTWRYFPGRPILVSTGWTFQGANDPYTG